MTKSYQHKPPTKWASPASTRRRWMTRNYTLCCLGVILLLTSLVLAGWITPTEALVTSWCLALLREVTARDAGTGTAELRIGEWWINTGPTESSKPASQRDDGAFLSRIYEQLRPEPPRPAVDRALLNDAAWAKGDEMYGRGWRQRGIEIRKEIDAYRNGRQLQVRSRK